MASQEHIGCNPDSCSSCTGCGGSIEKITLRIEWRHKGTDPAYADDIEESIRVLSSDLAVSGVELIYINNSFSPDIVEGTSEFLINGYPLNALTPVSPDNGVTREVLRKGIFQALLQNV